MDIEKKEKAKRIGLRIWLGISTALSLMFVVFVAIACSNVNSNKEANAESEVIEFHQDNKLNVVYDDDSYSLTLTADELNNYEFVNFYNILANLESASYNLQNESTEVLYTIDETSGESPYFVSFSENNGDDYIYFGVYFDNFGVQYKFTYYENNSTLIPFTNSYSIASPSEDTYLLIKSAIELDIQANNVQPFVPSIFTALTNSISGFIGTLGVGIVAITSIFWSNNALTTIGLLSVIVVSVSIAYWLFRLIIGLIRMRG